MQFLEFTKKWKGDFGFPPSQMHFAPTKFATGGCSGPGQVLRIHFCPGFVFLYLRKLLSPDTDLREVYSGILAWRVCWLEKENLARRRESESTPVERSLRQQEPPSLVSQINSTNFLEVAAARSHFQASLTLILQNCCQKESRSFSWTFVQRSNLLSFILRLVSISQSGFWSASMLLAVWCP